jgi:hypothetical protein
VERALKVGSKNRNLIRATLGVAGLHYRD